MVHTCFVQVPLQLHRRLHLHVVLEDAAAERGLVVGLPSRGLQVDDRLGFHPGLRHAGGDDPDAPHGFVVSRPVRHGVRLFRAEPGAKRREMRLPSHCQPLTRSAQASMVTSHSVTS